jgi:hypothetical protein
MTRTRTDRPPFSLTYRQRRRWYLVGRRRGARLGRFGRRWTSGQPCPHPIRGVAVRLKDDE